MLLRAEIALNVGDHLLARELLNTISSMSPIAGDDAEIADTLQQADELAKLL